MKLTFFRFLPNKSAVRLGGSALGSVFVEVLINVYLLCSD